MENLQLMSPEALMAAVVYFGPRVLGVLLLLIAGWIVAGWAGRLTGRALERGGVEATLTKFLGKLVRIAVLVMVVLAALGVFGVETTSFAAVLAAAGFAVGMAFQGTLSNFAAGVMLLIFRPFHVGDVVNVAGITGKVDEIGIFTTTLDTADNRRMILPNSGIFGANIENITYHDTRRVDVSVGVDYAADIDRTRGVLVAAAEGVDGIDHDRPVQAVLLGLGGSSVDWQLRVWCRTAEFFDVKDALTRAVKLSLDEAGIGIPFPQLDVHLDGSATKVG